MAESMADESVQSRRVWMGSSVVIAVLLPLLSPCPARSYGDRLPSPRLPASTIGPIETPDLSLPTVSPNTIYEPLPSPDRPLPKYRVIVDGNSLDMLQAVRRVVPRAFIQRFQGRRIIQIGSYNNLANAQRQVDALRTEGLPAEVVSPTNVTTESPEGPSTQVPRSPERMSVSPMSDHWFMALRSNRAGNHFL